MPLEAQVIAGAVDFTGLAAAGLFTFANLANFPADVYQPIVNSIFVSMAGGAANIQISRGLAATPAAERQVLFEGTGNSGGIRCRFIMPKDAGGVSMQLFVITTGKTAQGRAELDWIVGTVNES